MRVVATAGHVDHGKSSLVLALTGTDPDRLAEEKARGLTLDLGFAFTTLPSGVEVGFVDVPGHVRFLKNMLAGVGAVAVVVFVVSAREGWMPQSEEHLVILELLGVAHGVVALTNADVVDDDALASVRREVETRLARSALGRAAVLDVDSVSGRGLDDLRAALDRLLRDAPPAPDRDRPRLWVDRVFAPAGAGTVVTGTLTGGSIGVQDVLQVARTGATVRVRGVETAHRRVERAEPDARVALNLAGIDRSDVARGDALIRQEQWCITTVADVAITLAPDAELRPQMRLQAHVGSGEQEVMLRSLGTAGAYARVRFTSPVALVPGDRFVLRDPGREQTVAGAAVLDPLPRGPEREAAERLALPPAERLLDGRGWVATSDVPRLTGLTDHDAARLVAELVDGGRAVRVGNDLAAADLVERLLARTHDLVAGTGGVDLATVASTLGTGTERARVLVERDARFVVEHGIVRDARVAPITESPEAAALVAQLDAEPFSPPEVDDAALARALVRHGVLVDVDGIAFTRSAVDRARSLVTDQLATRGSISIGDARDLLASSRKYVVPLLEHFDREGLTRRRGDTRVPGPTFAPPPE
jgi:selenocysteine-specific elongation factor